MVRDIKLQFSIREINHIEEHEVQGKRILQDLEESIIITNPEKFVKDLASFTAFYFKLGEQYVWRYHQ